MANCLSCGRELPESPFGRADLCVDCRGMAARGLAVPRQLPVSAPAPAAVARRQPPVTTILVGINVAVYAAMVLTGVSAINPTVPQLLRWGANVGPLSLGPQPWRMLTSNYLHGGILHIGLNMWCLWNLGRLAERIFDPWTYVLTYLACGIAGSLASVWWHPMVVGVGASGAIFGLAGALIAALYLGRLPVPRQAMQGTLKSLIMFAGYNLFFGAVVGQIDNAAHLGGLIAGLSLGAVLAGHLTSPPEVRQQWRQVVFIAAAVVLFALFSLVRSARTRYVAPPAILIASRSSPCLLSHYVRAAHRPHNPGRRA
jgi:rhomboid protease GluP